MKLAAAIDAFVAHVRDERGLSPLTARAYEADLKSMHGYLSRGERDALALRDISPLHLKDHVAHLRDDLAYQPRSLSRALSGMRRFFAFCASRGWIEANPAENLRNPKAPRRLPHYLVDDEIVRLVRAPDPDHPEAVRDHALLVTFLFTGLRLSELTGLNLEDVDLASRAMRVMGKGSKERLVPLHDEVCRALRNYIDHHRPPVSATPQPVFVARGGRRMTLRAGGWAVRRAVLRAGLSMRTTPHKLRHTFATQLLQKGASLVEIKELLGHSQLATTSIYTHTNVNRLRSAVGKIAV